MLKETLKSIPKSPGIYQYFDKNGKIIYIGKSVNLKSRVNSYFNGTKKLNFAKQKMVAQIVDIQTILTNTEQESLILETTLIKKHLPKYNILMKDGKNHVYLKITHEAIPRLIKTRQKSSNSKGVYFGPYTSTQYVNNLLKITKKLFGHRSCNLQFNYRDTESQQELSGESKCRTTPCGGSEKILTIKNKTIKIPCLDYYIKRCSGPCLLGTKEIGEYTDAMEHIKKFLKGDISQVKKDLTEKMQEYSKNLNFEKAQELKLDIESLDILQEQQIVRDEVDGDYNIIHYLEKFDKVFIGMLLLRDGRITGFYSYEIKHSLEESKEEILETFIERVSTEPDYSTKKYILPFEICIPPSLQRRGLGGGFEVPQIGSKHDLLKLCYKNIYEFAYKKHLSSLSTKGFTKQTMKNLLHILGYERINKQVIFECNDISHLSGTYTVASRSVIENGKTANIKYRKFKIKDLETGKIDDFNSMREIMERRLKEIEKTGIIPDLIIIDGGKGQLSSVVEIVEMFLGNISTDSLFYQLLSKLQLVGIAKREEELFLPGKSTPILLSKDSQELRLVQKIRDEAHRFAITFNRDSRIKSMKKNILESLPGFGPVVRKKILQAFGNVENIKNIPKEELKKILTIPQIETLDDHGLLN